MTMHNPAHPGEILKELVIEPLELTITDVAEHLNVSRKTLSKVLNGRGAITLLISNLDQAEIADDMDLPGLRLHELSGSRKGTWSVTVNGNWRITFRFNGRDAEIVNYEDYH